MGNTAASTNALADLVTRMHRGQHVVIVVGFVGRSRSLASEVSKYLITGTYPEFRHVQTNGCERFEDPSGGTLRFLVLGHSRFDFTVDHLAIDHDVQVEERLLAAQLVPLIDQQRQRPTVQTVVLEDRWARLFSRPTPTNALAAGFAEGLAGKNRGDLLAELHLKLDRIEAGIAANLDLVTLVNSRKKPAPPDPDRPLLPDPAMTTP